MKLRLFLMLYGLLLTGSFWILPATLQQETGRGNSIPFPPFPADPMQEVDDLPSLPDKIVVANRVSGTISVIAISSNEVIGTHPLPDGNNEPEPMYIVHSHKRVFVGDRANNRVVVFNSRSFAVEGIIRAGAGVFHMWADPFDRQLWVNNDIDKTATVIDPVTLKVLATVPMPADIVAMGGKPHDVILDPQNGRFAYVTIVGIAGPNDYVVKFSTHNFEEVGRADVGKDPHVSATQHNKFLYVPCQNSNVVIVLNRKSMQQVKEIPVPAAHGAGMANDGKTFYTTNITGGGKEGLFAIDTNANEVMGEPTDTSYASPHNIALTPTRKLYITHSSALSNKVTVYKVKGRNSAPTYMGEVEVGLNPFGLAYVP